MFETSTPTNEETSHSCPDMIEVRTREEYHLCVLLICEAKYPHLLEMRSVVGLRSTSFSGWIDGTGLGVYRRVGG